MNKEKIVETQKKIATLERELIDTSQIVDDLIKRKRLVEKELQVLKNTLSNLVPKNLIVSDHSVLRYAERHYSFPFDRIKAEIEEKLKGCTSLQNLQYNGFIVRGNTVVTYVPQSSDGYTLAALNSQEGTL